MFPSGTRPTSGRIISIGATIALFASIATSASGAKWDLNNMHEEFLNSSCNAATECRVDFSNQSLDFTVKKVSCNFFFSSQNYNDVFVSGIVLGQASGNQNKFLERQYLAPVSPMFITASVNQYQVLADTLTVIPGGWRSSVEITFNKNTNAQMFCSVSGTLGG